MTQTELDRTVAEPETDPTSVTVRLRVNGNPESVTVPARTLLVDLLRDGLGLTGTNRGCDTSSCGSCTVLLDGGSVRSCSMLAGSAEDTEVVTVEGLAEDGALNPLQRAFREHHGLQCGFCTPGMLLAATSLLAGNPAPTEAEVRLGLKGNLCRCTGYHNIVKAVLAAAGSSD